MCIRDRFGDAVRRLPTLQPFLPHRPLTARLSQTAALINPTVCLGTSLFSSLTPAMTEHKPYQHSADTSLRNQLTHTTS